MYGEGMGTLNVHTIVSNDYNQNTLHWTRTGDAGPTWRLSRVTVPPSNVNFKVPKRICSIFHCFYHILLFRVIFVFFIYFC